MCSLCSPIPRSSAPLLDVPCRAVFRVITLSIFATASYGGATFIMLSPALDPFGCVERGLLGSSGGAGSRPPSFLQHATSAISPPAAQTASRIGHSFVFGQTYRIFVGLRWRLRAGSNLSQQTILSFLGILVGQHGYCDMHNIALVCCLSCCLFAPRVVATGWTLLAFLHVVVWCAVEHGSCLLPLGLLHARVAHLTTHGYTPPHSVLRRAE